MRQVEIMFPEEFILQDIRSPEMYRLDVAKSYALLLLQRETVDWAVVNAAIIKRWSPYALNYIKDHAWALVETG